MIIDLNGHVRIKFSLSKSKTEIFGPIPTVPTKLHIYILRRGDVECVMSTHAILHYTPNLH
jgi:hypothetical protein